MSLQIRFLISKIAVLISIGEVGERLKPSASWRINSRTGIFDFGVSKVVLIKSWRGG
jgi:hypothetical protein